MTTGDDVVARFRGLAEDYCETVESVSTLAPDVLVERFRALLAKLVAAALELPEVEPSSDEISASIDHEAWFERFGAIDQALGGAGFYWTVSDAIGEAEPEPVMLPVADDLADIWRDLKEPLLALYAGLPLQDAAWEWRFGFQAHWGAHAVEAIRALHHRVSE